MGKFKIKITVSEAGTSAGNVKYRSAPDAFLLIICTGTTGNVALNALSGSSASNTAYSITGGIGTNYYVLSGTAASSCYVAVAAIRPNSQYYFTTSSVAQATTATSASLTIQCVYNYGNMYLIQSKMGTLHNNIGSSYSSYYAKQFFPFAGPTSKARIQSYSQTVSNNSYFRVRSGNTSTTITSTTAGKRYQSVTTLYFNPSQWISRTISATTAWFSIQFNSSVSVRISNQSSYAASGILYLYNYDNMTQQLAMSRNVSNVPGGGTQQITGYPTLTTAFDTNYLGAQFTLQSGQYINGCLIWLYENASDAQAMNNNYIVYFSESSLNHFTYNAPVKGGTVNAVAVYLYS